MEILAIRDNYRVDPVFEGDPTVAMNQDGRLGYIPYNHQL